MDGSKRPLFVPHSRSLQSSGKGKKSDLGLSLRWLKKLPSDKKLPNLKVENCCFIQGITKNDSLETASQIALKKYSKEAREEPEYIGVADEKQTNVVEHQNITANHKKNLN